MTTEVITTPDKAQRDKMFQELRSSTITVKKMVRGKQVDVVVPHPTESQVVKFSDVEELTPISIDAKTKKIVRPTYRSTWSVAYPAN